MRVAKEFAGKFQGLLGERLPLQFDTEEGPDNIHYVLSKLEQALTSLKHDNTDLRLQLSSS